MTVLCWFSRTVESVEQLTNQVEPEMTKKAAQSDFLQKKARGYRTAIKQLTVNTAAAVWPMCVCVCVCVCVCDIKYCSHVACVMAAEINLSMMFCLE